MSVHPNVAKIVTLITNEITTTEGKKQRWASFKRENVDVLKQLLGLAHTNVEKPGNLIGFDIDEARNLILMNYTGTAHNVLHEVQGGWTSVLKDMRGLVYEFGGHTPRLVGRGFEKFFNYNEVKESNCSLLESKYGLWTRFPCREKADGHMIEYFVHRGELCSTTRGKFGTASAGIASNMLGLSDFRQVEKTLSKNILSIVVELVHPTTEVFVDYDNAEMLYLLAAYDSDGQKLSLSEVNHICDAMPATFTAPNSREMSLNELISEVNNREVANQEGWVADFNGQLVKFKYISYIGKMVESKLSYKYLMNCIKNNRLDHMLITLPEEVRATAYNMVGNLNQIAEMAVSCGDHKLLYQLHSPMEAGESYFRTVCRNYFKYLTS